MSATIRDIASHCNISVSTVSKYLNGGAVRNKNRIAIEQAISLYDYKVNTIARGLKTKRSYTVGIVVPTIDSTYFGMLVSGIESLLYKNGYTSIVGSYILGDLESEKSKIEFILSKSVDALILVPLLTKRRHLEGVHVPIILVDRTIDDFPCDSVVINNTEIVRKAVDLMLQAGHRRIGFLAGIDTVSCLRDRLRGYYEAFDSRHLKVAKENVIICDYTMETTYTMTTQLLNMPMRPTAIMAANGQMSMGALLAITEKGLSIPEDISFVGFDYSELAPIFHPPLYTVIQDTEAICQETVNLVLERLQNRCSYQQKQIVLDAVLYEGKSICRLTEADSSRRARQ